MPDSKPTLKVDGNLILASEGQFILGLDSLDRHDDLGVGWDVDLSYGADMLRGVIASIDRDTGNIRVVLQ